MRQKFLMGQHASRPKKYRRIETTRDCGGRKQRFSSGQLISCVVPREKRVSGDLLLTDRAEEERRQFLLDLPQSLR